MLERADLAESLAASMESKNPSLRSDWCCEIISLFSFLSFEETSALNFSASLSIAPMTSFMERCPLVDLRDLNLTWMETSEYFLASAVVILFSSNAFWRDDSWSFGFVPEMPFFFLSP